MKISVNSVCLTSFKHVGLYVFSLGNIGEKGAIAHNVPAANQKSPHFWEQEAQMTNIL